MTSERLLPEVRVLLAQEIARAGGREVCFVGSVDEAGTIVAARPVARGTAEEVLALPGVAERGQLVLHNHPGGELEPSPADLFVAVRLHDAGVGFGIINNDATELYVVVEVPRRKRLERLDPLSVVATLGPRGPIAARLSSFEDRQGQRDMAAHIADAYNDGGVVLLEAGTGIGKSFAYLVPALAWAKRNGERTIISTNTINLQEQLVGKDLPLLRDALGDAEHTPSFALLKGWRNYLCLARLNAALANQQSLFEPDRQDELVGLGEWASRSADGTLGDLTVPPSPEVWDEVAAEPDLCPRLRCPHFEKCFLFRAKRAAAEADVVVVNHHLLAADLSVRSAQENWDEAAVLPPYRRLVLDEAHHLEDVAAAHLGAQVTSRGVRRVLARLERNGKGLLPSLRYELGAQLDLLGRASLDLLQQRLLPALADARRFSDALFRRLHALLQEGRAPLRLDADFAQAPSWAEGLTAELDGTLATFERIREDVETIAERLSQSELTERRTQLLGELRGVVRRLEGVSDGLNRALRPPPGGPPTVRWIERAGSKGDQLALAAVPLDLAPILRELLFDRLTTVALTSATLAAGGEFDFLESRVGLAAAPNPVTVREILPSPFNYPEQCLFGVPSDLADPREDEAAHDAGVVRAITELAWASDGGTFALFTSHAALRRAATELRATLPPRWPILVQGERSRDQLLRRFREAGNAILLGTDSFWEGVDVPGRALRVLLLCKLPFKVPSEPLTAARLERLAEQGEDGFMGYLLPHAALKLKQGFGRLIRNSTDVGVVILLDRRVLSKRYGPLVLSGLPRAERVIGTWTEVRTKCEDFFARHGIGASV
ncbi:MAG TPA: helicase C-terminal domain-containing protein [Gemmatimonadales bacterium]|nr:helicase C-terminal domain-containing protein [Gemmatimonadales bacterium]